MISELRLDKFAKHQLVLQFYPLNHYFSITNKSLTARRVLNLVLPTPNNPISCLIVCDFFTLWSHPPLGGCRVEKDGCFLHLCIGRNELITKHLKKKKRQVVSQCPFIQLVITYILSLQKNLLPEDVIFTPAEKNVLMISYSQKHHKQQHKHVPYLISWLLYYSKQTQLCLLEVTFLFSIWYG